jgi:hypothetical protein
VSSGSAAACESDDPLHITADPAVAPTLSALADDFAAAPIAVLASPNAEDLEVLFRGGTVGFVTGGGRRSMRQSPSCASLSTGPVPSAGWSAPASS